MEIKTIRQLMRKRYLGMIGRCFNQNRNNYRFYGMKGISVDKSWLDSFENFFNDMFTENYQKGLTLDRIDNKLNYSKDNCKWSTKKQQLENRSSRCSLLFLTYNNNKYSITQLSKLLNVSYYKVYREYKEGLYNEVI